MLNRDAETPFVFELTVADRTFFFCAADEETLKEWMDAIKRSKSEWWKSEHEKKGKSLERKPAIPRDPSAARLKCNEESAKVRFSCYSTFASLIVYGDSDLFVRKASTNKTRERGLLDKTRCLSKDVEEAMVCCFRRPSVLFQFS